jgi:hypothetical protein
MSSVTGTTTLNFTVPTDEASELTSIFSQMGLIPTSDDGSTDGETTGGDEGYLSDSFGGTSSAPTLTESTDSSGNVNVNDGTYTIEEGAEDDGSVKIINKDGTVVDEIEGDPHVYADGQHVADIQQSPFNVKLSDGTIVTVDPTALTNGVSHVGAVTVSNDYDQIQINSKTGAGQGFENGVKTTGVSFVPGAASEAQYNNASGVNLYAADDGNLFASNDSTGGLDSLTATNGTPINLDTDQQATGAVSSSGAQTSMQQIEQLLNMIITYEQQQQQQELSQLQSLLGGLGSSGFGLGSLGSLGSGLNFSSLFESPIQTMNV